MGGAKGVTHVECRERRKAIVSHVKRTRNSTSKTAELFKVTSHTITSALREAGVTRIRGRPQMLASRRKEIVDHLRSTNDTHTATAACFGISATTVTAVAKRAGYRRCLEVEGRKHVPVRERVYYVLKELTLGNLNQTGIAQKFGCSRQRVGQVRDGALQAGLVLHDRYKRWEDE